ncbi:MAG: hypothetical protein ACLFO2_00880 [Candidatus Woesearchaeota archaeon]
MAPVIRTRIPENALLVCVALVFLVSLAGAEPLQPDFEEPVDQVIVNSQDWKDIYHGLMFAELTGKPGDYIVSVDAADDVVASLPEDKESVLLIQPRRNQQYRGTRRLLEDEGFEVTELSPDESIGLELARLLPLQRVFVTDERYPYNAVSLAPYAIQQDSFVLFPDPVDVEDTVSLIERKDVPVTTYGILDPSVVEALRPFDPDVIDEGGKFDNNILLVKRFLEENPVEQVALTNGEFLEESLVTDFNPVLFLGTTNVPRQVESFLAESQIENAVVVGNTLADTASDLKRTLKTGYDKEMSFVIKFAKTPRVRESQFSLPVPLEYVALPIIRPELNLTSLAFNRLTGQLEATFRNPSQISVFSLATFALETGGGDQLSAGDDEPVIIAPGQRKTVLYDLSGFEGGLASAEGVVIYGDAPNALEHSFTKTFDDVREIEIPDYAELEIEKAVYDVMDEAFFIRLHNPGDVPVYAHLELPDVIVDGLPATLGTDRPVSLQPGETREVFVRAELSRLDREENENVTVHANYGEREDVLFKTVEETFPFSVRYVRRGVALAGAALLVAVLVVLWLFRRRGGRAYVCDRCGHVLHVKNPPVRHECGGRFRRA